MSLMKHDCHTHWRSIIPSYSRSLRPCHTHWWSFYHVHILPKDWWNIIPWCFTSLQSCYTHWWKHHPIMLHNFTVMLNTDGSIIPSCSQSLQPCHMHWWSTIPLCYSSYQRIDEASSHYVILPTKGLMKHHPIMLHSLTAISCTLMKQIRSCFTSLQPCHTHWWKHPPLMLTHIPYSHFIPYGGASYHHVHTLTATSHPTVEPPTIMLTHLQPHHTQLWSLLPSCSHTYSHVTPNDRAFLSQSYIFISHLDMYFNSHTYIHVTLNDGDCLSRLGFQHKQLVDLKHTQHRSAFTQLCI